MSSMDRIPSSEEEPEEVTTSHVQKQIADLEQLLADRSRLLGEKRREFDGQVLDVEAARSELSAAEQRLASAQAELRAAEQERSSLLPLYERCQQNKDQHRKAEEFKSEIARIESSIREADVRVKALEARLQDVSTEYKAERERRCLLADRVASMVDDLRNAVEEKVMLTLPIDESTTIPHAQVCLRAISENARERELTIARCARHAAELSAVVQMKQQRVQELRVESDRDLAALRAVKDEQIKRLVLKFDEERRSIQQDIDAVIAANAEHQRQLRSTRLMPAESSAGTTIAERVSGAAKREAAKNSITLQQLAAKVREADTEREAMVAALQTAKQDRDESLKVLRELNLKIQQQETEHQLALKQYAEKIHQYETKSAQLEKENQKLEEACDVLVASIEAARRALTASSSTPP